MALQILFDIARSADFKSILITDDGTTWGQGGEIDKGDVTSIALKIYGTDKINALKTVTFTAQERTDFLTGSGTTLLFSDSRLWSTTYAPDNFYTGELIVNGGTGTTSTLEAFDSYYYIYKLVMENIANVHVDTKTYYEANRSVVGDIVSLIQLQYLSDVISIDRENKWRKIYDFLAWNYDL